MLKWSEIVLKHLRLLDLFVKIAPRLDTAWLPSTHIWMASMRRDTGCRNYLDISGPLNHNATKEHTLLCPANGNDITWWMGQSNVKGTVI